MHQKIFSLIVISLLVFSFSLPAYADEKEEQESMVVETVEVTGETTLNKTIQSVSVITGDDLKKYHPEGIKSILNMSAGFLTLSGGHYGQMAYSFARGAGTNQTLFLVDGFKITDPANSLGLNLTFLSPHLIEKVEIVRGPLSNMYGSNAMGGVVNLVTRNKEGAEASAFLGSHGSYDTNVFLSKKIGDYLNLSVNGSLIRYSDGLENDEFKNNGITLKSNYHYKDFKVGLMAFGNFADSGIPLNLGLPTPNRKYKQNNFLLALPLSWVFNDHSKLNLKLSHNSNKYEFEDSDDPWLPYYENKSIVNEARLNFHTSFAQVIKLHTGVDYSDQKILNRDSFSTAIDNEKTHYISAFVNAGLDLKKLLLSASLRYDKYRDIDAVFSPQVGFSYLVAKKFKIRGAYSQSFRAPTLPELLNPLWGNPELEVEKGKSFEIGADLYTKPVIFSAVYFTSNYENLIGFSPLTFRFANLSKVDISGIELSTRFTLFETLTLQAAYTYLDTNDLQYERELLRRPKHALSAVISYNNRYFNLGSEMTYVGKRLDYNELTWSVGHSPAFNTFNVLLFVPVNDYFSIVGKMTNAFDKEYQEVMGYPAPSRRFLIGIKYRMKNRD